MIRWRSTDRFSRWSGRSSIITFSAVVDSGSRSFRRRATRLDLPLPVRPQIAIFSLELMFSWMSRRARLVVVSSFCPSALIIQLALCLVVYEL